MVVNRSSHHQFSTLSKTSGKHFESKNKNDNRLLRMAVNLILVYLRGTTRTFSGKLDLLTSETIRVMLYAAMPGALLLIAFNSFLDFSHFTGLIPLDSSHLWSSLFGTQLEVGVLIFLCSAVIGITVMGKIQKAVTDSIEAKIIESEKLMNSSLCKTRSQKVKSNMISDAFA